MPPLSHPAVAKHIQPRGSSPLSFALSSFTLRKGGSPVRRKSACPIPMSSSICLCPGCRQETDSDGDELHHELHPTNTKPRPDMAQFGQTCCSQDRTRTVLTWPRNHLGSIQGPCISNSEANLSWQIGLANTLSGWECKKPMHQPFPPQYLD